MARKRDTNPEAFGDAKQAVEEAAVQDVLDTLVAATPETVAPVATPQPVAETFPLVTAEVFAKTRGMRRDQTAGFFNWARRKQIAYRTIPEWTALFHAFRKTPTA